MDSFLLDLIPVLKIFLPSLIFPFPVLSPEIVTGTAARKDLLVVDRMNNLYIIELTVGHESNTVQMLQERQRNTNIF